MSQQSIPITTRCPYGDGACRPGRALLERLGAALTVAAPMLDEDFHMSGTARIAACPMADGGDCPLRWSASPARLTVSGPPRTGLPAPPPPSFPTATFGR